jgi:hypothetical protein
VKENDDVTVSAQIERLPAPGAVERLAALDPESFIAAVKATLSQSPDPAIWQALTDPRVLARTQAALTGFHRDIEDQLAQRRADMDAFQGECFARGPGGKDEWFSAKREYDEWRRRALGFRRFVQQRESFAQQAATAAHITAAGRPGAKGARGRHNLDTLLAVARAVARHKDRVLNADDSGPADDEALWASLADLTVQTGQGEMRLGEWLAYVETVTED